MKVATHVLLDEEILDRIDRVVDDSDLSKSEVIRRTLGYGIGEMERAIRRFLDKSTFEGENDNG